MRNDSDRREFLDYSYKEPTWFLRDARASAVVRHIDGKQQRFNPSFELAEEERLRGNKKSHGTWA